MDARIAALAQIAIHHVATLSRRRHWPQAAHGWSFRKQRGIEEHVDQQGDVVGSGLAARIHRKQLRKLFDEQRVVSRGVVLAHAILEQCIARTRIDDLRTQCLEIHQRSLDDVDALAVGGGEQILVHVFAHHADANPLESPFLGRAVVALLRQPPDTERSELVFWIVAGDDIEDRRHIFHVATRRTNTVIHEGRRNHAVAAHELLRRRERDDIVVLRRIACGRTGFFADGAHGEIGRDRSA